MSYREKDISDTFEGSKPFTGIQNKKKRVNSEIVHLQSRAYLELNRTSKRKPLKAVNCFRKKASS